MSWTASGLPSSPFLRLFLMIAGRGDVLFGVGYVRGRNCDATTDEPSIVCEICLFNCAQSHINVTVLALGCQYCPYPLSDDPCPLSLSTLTYTPRTGIPRCCGPVAPYLNLLQHRPGRTGLGKYVPFRAQKTAPVWIVRQSSDTRRSRRCDVLLESI